MPRILKSSLLLASAIIFCTLGCKTREGAADGNVVLLLPYSVESERTDRQTKLTIDGKAETIKAGPDREHSIKIPSGKDVTIVYSYWPYQYSNTIRTKKVKVEAGATIRVDFKKLDKGLEDKIIPIYVPTPPEVVDDMCKMAKVGKDDIVYDIGCGDGRLVITAVKKFNAKKGVGVDLNPERIKECKENAEKAGVTDRVEFRKGDALDIKDLSDATVVLLYVGEDLGNALEPVLRKTLKPGSRVVSHRFPLGDWKPDAEETVKRKDLNDELDEFVLKLWVAKASREEKGKEEKNKKSKRKEGEAEK